MLLRSGLEAASTTHTEVRIMMARLTDNLLEMATSKLDPDSTPSADDIWHGGQNLPRHAGANA